MKQRKRCKVVIERLQNREYKMTVKVRFSFLSIRFYFPVKTYYGQGFSHQGAFEELLEEIRKEFKIKYIKQI